MITISMNQRTQSERIPKISLCSIPITIEMRHKLMNKLHRETDNKPERNIFIFRVQLRSSTTLWGVEQEHLENKSLTHEIKF